MLTEAFIENLQGLEESVFQEVGNWPNLSIVRDLRTGEAGLLLWNGRRNNSGGALVDIYFKGQKRGGGLTYSAPYGAVLGAIGILFEIPPFQKQA